MGYTGRVAREIKLKAAQEELSSYLNMLETYTEWRQTVYRESFADATNVELRRQFSEQFAMFIDDITKEQFEELESDYRRAQN